MVVSDKERGYRHANANANGKMLFTLILRNNAVLAFTRIAFLIAVCPYFTAYGSTPVPPWSKMITSDNGRFVLVLISPRIAEQEEYTRQSREFWRKGGIPSGDVPVAENSLKKEIQRELHIRKKYRESGLYTTGNVPILIWPTDVYDNEAWIRISDDGNQMVIGKWIIPGKIEERPLEFNPAVKEVVSVNPRMDSEILFFFTRGQRVRAYKASEIIPQTVTLVPNSDNNFVWGAEGAFADSGKTFRIELPSSEILRFDIPSGDLTSGKQVLRDDPGSANGSKSSGVNCFSPALFLMTVLSITIGSTYGADPVGGR